MQPFNFLPLAILAGFASASGVLQQPPVVDLTSGQTLYLYAQYETLTVREDSDDSASDVVVTLETRAFCYSLSASATPECAIPGPTIKLRPGVTSTVVYANSLTGSSAGQGGVNFTQQCGENIFFHDPDVTNLHTHGLHVDPKVDDVLFVKINASQSNTYPYAIPVDHYPGSHWYHAHWHGSVTLQSQGGMAGALLVEPTEPIPALAGMEETVLFLTAVHLKPMGATGVTGGCQACQPNVAVRLNQVADFEVVLAQTDQVPGGRLGAFSPVATTCDVWCAMPPGQRDASGGRPPSETAYYNGTYGNGSFYLVNGQYEPELQVVADRWHRLRLFNGGAQAGFQLKMPSGCQALYFAADGVFFEHPRDVMDPTGVYQGYLLLQAAGRVDVAINCPSGTYELRNHNATHPTYGFVTLPLVDSNFVLLKLTAAPAPAPETDFSTDSVFPDHPAYLMDTRTLPSVEPNCDCTSYNPGSDHSCRFTVGFANKCFDLTALPFNSSRPLMWFEANRTYQINVTFGPHPFHLHINPYQLQHSIAVNNSVGDGYVAQEGEWRDTLGIPTSQVFFTARTHTFNFTGNVVMHCHFLPHEDTGLMGYLTIQNASTFANCTLPFRPAGLKQADEQCPADDDTGKYVAIGLLALAVVVLAVLLFRERKKHGKVFGDVVADAEPISLAQQEDE